MTSTDSGLSVPDWPLSYGKIMPPMVGGIRFEHTHRLVASTVGLLTLILTIWIGRTEKRAWVRRLAIAALGAVVLQGILGGLTVLFLLPAPISVTHACLGPIFFCLIVNLTLLHSPAWNENLPPFSSEDAAKNFRFFSLLTFISAFIQLLLGAVVRHTGQGIVFHILSAVWVLALTGIVVVQSSACSDSHSQIQRLAFFLGFLVLIEFFLGIGTFIFTRVSGIPSGLGRVLFPTLHQTLGSLILATALVLTLKSSKEVAIGVSL